MTYQLRTLHQEAIPRAWERAERYRLLNEPWQAESICRDILAAQPDHQQALVTLLLALTDQFGGPGAVSVGVGVNQARELLPRIADEYQRVYYEGVIDERWAKATLQRGLPGHVVHDWFAAALHCYDRAEKLSPAGNEDAVLRWNACVRLLERHPEVRPHLDLDDDQSEAGFTDHVPPR